MSSCRRLGASSDKRLVWLVLIHCSLDVTDLYGGAELLLQLGFAAWG